MHIFPRRTPCILFFNNICINLCQSDWFLWCGYCFGVDLGYVHFNALFHTLSSSLPGSDGKESACDAGGPGLIPGLGRSAGEGKGDPLQYSSASLVAQLVKNPSAMWETWVGKILWRRERLPTPVFWPGEFHGVAKSWMQPSNFHFLLHCRWILY